MIKLFKKYNNGFYYVFIKVKGYGVGWFTDCGDWFFYIYLGKRGIRFSSAGFMTY